LSGGLCGYGNDPAFDDYPVSVPRTEFELAWLVFDYRYGIIKK
jgi:hypothetical protein